MNEKVWGLLKFFSWCSSMTIANIYTNNGDQGTVIGTLLIIMTVIIIINLNLHIILIIEFLVESYETLPL